MSETQTIEPLLLTVSDLCRLLSVSRSQFFTQRLSGRIPLQPVWIGSKLLYRRDEITEWVRQGCPVKNWQWQEEISQYRCSFEAFANKG